MLFQVCDPPETIGIGIIQPDETKTYIKKQENAWGFLMDKLTKLPTSSPALVYKDRDVGIELQRQQFTDLDGLLPFVRAKGDVEFRPFFHLFESFIKSALDSC